MKFLNYIKNHLALLIPIMLILGLVKGHWFPMEYSRMICISALLIMIFPVFVNLEFDKGIKGDITGGSIDALMSVYGLVQWTQAGLYLIVWREWRSENSPPPWDIRHHLAGDSNVPNIHSTTDPRAVDGCADSGAE